MTFCFQTQKIVVVIYTVLPGCGGGGGGGLPLHDPPRLLPDLGNRLACLREMSSFKISSKRVRNATSLNRPLNDSDVACYYDCLIGEEMKKIKNLRKRFFRALKRVSIVFKVFCKSLFLIILVQLLP